MFKAAVLTVSDRSFRGERPDEGGPLVVEILKNAGYAVTETAIVPDEKGRIEAALRQWCDREPVDLIVTTGGTGFAPRDVTPEATIAVCDRLTPGIPEAMRYASMQVTDRAMLSRATAGIRGRTLIVNLPGSPKAVREALEAAGVPMAEADVTMIPQTWVELTDEDDIKKINRILDMLDEDDDVQATYHNWDE